MGTPLLYNIYPFCGSMQNSKRIMSQNIIGEPRDHESLVRYIHMLIYMYYIYMLYMYIFILQSMSCSKILIYRYSNNNVP